MPKEAPGWSAPERPLLPGLLLAYQGLLLLGTVAAGCATGEAGLTLGLSV